VREGAGGEGFVQEVVLLGSAMGLSEEGVAADGGESGCASAGGVEKGGLLAGLVPFAIKNFLNGGGF
jgi:hypothetical protein